MSYNKPIVVSVVPWKITAVLEESGGGIPLSPY